jgi:beta-galactosidase
VAPYYGGDYNPEQWPRAVWQQDVRLMREAGVNLVTVGIFSWAHLEPTEGSFNFGWLREVMDLLGAAGIGVDLATPTASPPPWMTTAYADVLPVDARGARYSHGSRQHFCVCSPNYRRLALRIVDRLVQELGDHEALHMWHAHNEYACHVPYCYCDQHTLAFRAWLQSRYGSVEELNQAWGTDFWSQRYSDFAEVLSPRLTPTYSNPGQTLDYMRFSSDAFLDEFLEEKQVLKAARPDVPVTTNFMGFFKPLDYFNWAHHLDMVSTDNYQDPTDPRSAAVSAMHFDLIRSLNKDVPWMVMEQASFRVNWRERNVPKVPGQMRAFSYQALARGASGILFFQWRASRAGAEKWHSAMVPHSGEASPVWAEVAALGRELAHMEPVVPTRVQAAVAVAFSWPNWWAVESRQGPAHDFSMQAQLNWMLMPLYERNVTIDFCRPEEDLGAFRAVVVPSLYLVTEKEAANIVAFVERGGTAVISFWSGIVDEHDRVYLGPYGGPLRALFGCEVLDVAPLADGEVVEIEWEDGATTSASYWTDLATEGDGKVLARLSNGPWAGRPAVVETAYGDGSVLYVATRLDDAGLARLYDRVPSLQGRGVDDGAVGPAGRFERVLGRHQGSDWEFLVNHTNEEHQAELACSGLDVVRGQPVANRLTLPPWGVAVVRCQ